MRTNRFSLFAVLLLLLVTLPLPGTVGSAAAQGPPAAPTAAPADTLTLTLEGAVRVALNRNYDIQNARLDVRNAEEQVQQAWGQVLPQVNVSSSYTRNVVTANPFAGSNITGLFAGGNSADWVAFNERARQDTDPSTDPITFGEFQQRQRQARREAGIMPGGGGGNPFSVANQFRTGVTLRQTLFNRSAFSAVQGASELMEVNERALDRQRQLLIDEVRGAFYQALLAQAQARVAEESVERARRTLEEVSQQVAAGTAPKADRLSAEVQLANAQTQLVEARNQARLAVDDLKLTLGVPIEENMRLLGELAVEDPAALDAVTADKAAAVAFEKRPDVERARLTIDLRQIQKSVTKGERWPTLSAVANFNYTGRVPSDRSVVFSNPNDPFQFSKTSRDFFADPYWNPSFNIGLELSWSIFSGTTLEARLDKDQIAIERAQIQYEQLHRQVRLQVQRALRNLRAARQRIDAQQENLETARTSYEFAQRRLEAGVATPLQVREASEQLDRTRLNYLQAVYDYLDAKSAFLTAIGMPMAGPAEVFELTRE